MSSAMSDSNTDIQVRIFIRRNSDGVIAEKICDFKDGGWQWPKDKFWWTEGNASCDCNRGDWFNRNSGVDDSDCECGHTAYSIWVTDMDEKEVFSEFEKDEQL